MHTLPFDITANKHKGAATSVEANLRVDKAAMRQKIYEEPAFVQKKCNKCGVHQPRNTHYYGINRAMKDGFKSTCKNCEKSASRKPYGYLAPKEKLLEYDTERFWALVKKTGKCWLWQGGQTDDHYGRFASRLFGKRFRAHRFVWFLTYGEMPPDDKAVCHECDTPLCVNPKCLWLGTGADNAKDMWAKGRANPQPHRGEENGRSKLTEQQVYEIRALYKTGKTSIPKLAKEYGVSTTVIHQVVVRKSWKHLPEMSEMKALNLLEETGEKRDKCFVLRVVK